MVTLVAFSSLLSALDTKIGVQVGGALTSTSRMVGPLARVVGKVPDEGW